MNEALGPHTLISISPDGEECTITVTLQPGPDAWVDLGDHQLRLLTGSAVIEADWFERRFEVQAPNDVQLVFRMLRLVDVYVQKICADNGYGLYVNVEGDVTEPYDTIQ